MASLGKIYPCYVTEAVTCITGRFSWSDKLLTVLDAKLERFKFATLFTIADMCWVKKQPEDAKN